MTHSQHRRGTSASLKNDYVVLAMIDPAVEAQQNYKRPREERVRLLLEILAKHGPLALSVRKDGKRLRYIVGWEPRMGSGVHHSMPLEKIARCEHMDGVGSAVYASQESVQAVLKDLKEADLGISIVVSGIFDDVFETCKLAGLEPHTVNMSLGTWGKTELLPKDEILELLTMCGHALISPELVEMMVDRVKYGVLSLEEAAVELAKQCMCNIVNPERAVSILARLASADPTSAVGLEHSEAQIEWAS